MAKNSVASTPVKSGEVPANVKPQVSYHDVAAAAATRIDALMTGGAVAVTFIASALLVGYLEQHSAASGKGVKLSVIKDEFALMLKKKGLGATQTGKYIDYGQTIAARMFKECQYGMEMAALIAATTADKAHNAVNAWIRRHTDGKKTEHGYKLTTALERLNVLAIFLGKEPDPNKPETLTSPETPAEKAKKDQDARKRLADKIGKDPAVLGEVNSERLLETVSKVIAFPVLVSKHFETVTNEKDLLAEFKAIEASFKARLKALSANLGTKSAGTKKIKGEAVKETVAA